MLFAVYSYCGKRRISFDEKLAVLDTSDCTVESVAYKELNDSGVVIGNLSSTVSGVMIEDFALQDILHNYERDYVHYVGSCLCIGDMIRLQISRTESSLRINNKFIRSGFWCRLAYPFIWHDYLVLRFVDGFIAGGSEWHTVVYDLRSRRYVADWNNKMSLVTDKKLATKIDMISEV